MAQAPSFRRTPPMRTLGLESAEDLRTFRDALAKRLVPPRLHIALRLEALSELRCTSYERRINRLLRAKGWAEGALAALVLLGLTALYPWAPPHADALAATAWQVAELAAAMALGAAAGQRSGLWLARWRLQRLCGRIERELPPS